MITRKKLFTRVMLITLLGLAYTCSHFISFPNNNSILGVSFDPAHARYLGLDSPQVFTKIITDWNFRYVRIPAHWNEVEKSPGVFDFTEIDELLAVANKSGIKIMLAVGQKTPRWPECHIPDWAAALSQEEYQKHLRLYVGAVVHHYKNNPALEMWQVENEPFFSFGDCPAFTSRQLKEEINLVKSLDPTHPTITADSGELSTWIGTITAADFFGTTMYRTVWNKYLGYVSYNFIPAVFYRAKLALFGRAPSQAFILELQAEPWLPGKHISEVSLDEQYQSLNLVRLQKNIAYAKQVGLPRVYLWGAEWWYWLEQEGHQQIPEYIMNLKK